MKRTNLTFLTEVDDIACTQDLYTRASIGWLIDINYDEEGLLHSNIKILHITLYGNEPEKRLTLPYYNIEIINEYCIGLDQRLRPNKLVLDFNNNSIQINF